MPFNQKHRARIKAKKVARKTNVVVRHQGVPYDPSPKPHPSGVIITRRIIKKTEQSVE